jgi:hypothetical protein
VDSAPLFSATAAATSSPSPARRTPDAGDLACVGVLVEDVLDLARVDVESAADDELLLAVDDEEVTVLVDPGYVAGAEPPAESIASALAMSSPVSAGRSDRERGAR